jgi:uncharacterized membrane protein
MMGGFGVLGLLVMVLFWGGLIAGGVFLARTIFPNGKVGRADGSQQDGNARNTLDLRYARGEISRSEYDVIRKDLEI